MPASSKQQQQPEVDETLRFGFRVICSTALHPLEYAKTLIQLGYEPIAPRPGRTLLGGHRMMLPNFFQYAAYIKSVDGFMGCFRGLSAKLAGNIISTYYSEKLAFAIIGPPKKPNQVRNDEWNSWFHKSTEEEDDKEDEDASATRRGIVHETVTHVCGIVLSHPFHVISIRMMAQFIGREHVYDGLFGSIKEIWVHEGIPGFFAGIIPRLWMDLCCLALTKLVGTLFANMVGGNKAILGNVDTIAHFTFTSMFYPYHVVSTCMAVQGSRLKAGNPPMMDYYINWQDCYSRLRMAGAHKRGSSFFFRAVTSGPAKLNNSFAPYPDLK